MNSGVFAIQHKALSEVILDSASEDYQIISRARCGVIYVLLVMKHKADQRKVNVCLL